MQAASADSANPATVRCRCFWHGPARGSDESVRATIIIPTYQSAATLARAIQSAVDQTMRDIEIIVADDGSTDSTWPMIEDWLDREPRLRALRNERNCGKSAMMNCATSFARGRWIAVLDADDWYHPERLAALVAIGERRNVAMVADNQLLYDAAADTVVGAAWPAAGDAARNSAGAEWSLSFDDYLLGANAYDSFNLGMLKPIVRSEFVRASRLAYDERARFSEDYLYLLELFARGGDAVVVDAPYYFYTQPFGAVSQRWSHGTRRRYDFRAARDLVRSHLHEIAGRLSPRQTSFVARTCRRLDSLEHYFSAKDSLKRQGWRAFVARLVTHPSAFDYALHRLFDRQSVSAAERVATQSRRRAIRAREAPRMRVAAHAKH
jgi:succinoglycan biosynthesis protein ExoO